MTSGVLAFENNVVLVSMLRPSHLVFHRPAYMELSSLKVRCSG